MNTAIIKKTFALLLLIACISRGYAQYPGKNEVRHLLLGAVDMHIHSAPDAFDRSLDDFDLAALAEKEGLKAIVIKNHVSSTAGRAELVSSRFKNIKVFGGIALNKAVGGINPDAVSWMARLSPEHFKLVWFPTFDADHHKRQFGQDGEGISILKNGQLIPEAVEILHIIVANNLVLATGHVSPQEVEALVNKGNELGLKKMVITHPMGDAPDMDINGMKALAEKGALLELTYLSYVSGPQAPLGFLQQSYHVSLDKMVEAIREIGAEHFILSTDLGQSGNPTAPDGFKNFVKLMLGKGITEEEISVMIRDNPSRLLDLQAD